MWTDEAYKRWWKAMGGIFGRDWYDKNGPEPTDLWKDSLRRLSIDRARQLIEHYRTSGDAYPPNLSQVVALTKTMRYPSVTEPPRRIEYKQTPEVIAHAIEDMRLSNKRQNAFLPGEGLGDFLDAQRKSGMSYDEFTRHRLRRFVDKEADAEREAIQQETQ